MLVRLELVERRWEYSFLFLKLNARYISLIDMTGSLPIGKLSAVIIINQTLFGLTCWNLYIFTMKIMNLLSVSLLWEDLSLCMLILLLQYHRSWHICTWTEEPIDVCGWIITSREINWFTKCIVVSVFETFEVIKCWKLMSAIVCSWTCGFTYHSHMIWYFMFFIFIIFNTDIGLLLKLIKLWWSMSISASTKIITSSGHERLIIGVIICA